MSDVRKALEAATDAAMNARVMLDAGWDEIARAAVLAFLRAMPDRHWVGHLCYNTTVAELTAAIEKEARG